MKLDEIEHAIGVKIAIIVAGFIGSLIQISLNPKLSFTGAVASVAAGVACAAYLSPIIPLALVGFFDVPHPRAELALAFFTGLLGMQIMAKVYVAFGKLTLPEIFNWLSNFFKKGSK